MNGQKMSINTKVVGQKINGLNYTKNSKSTFETNRNEWVNEFSKERAMKKNRKLNLSTSEDADRPLTHKRIQPLRRINSLFSSLLQCLISRIDNSSKQLRLDFRKSFPSFRVIRNIYIYDYTYILDKTRRVKNNVIFNKLRSRRGTGFTFTTRKRTRTDNIYIKMNSVFK